jgi:hypothetical protein
MKRLTTGMMAAIAVLFGGMPTFFRALRSMGARSGLS